MGSATKCVRTTGLESDRLFTADIMHKAPSTTRPIIAPKRR